jgi:hypothetical protein
MARRTKFTAEVQQRICQAIELGATYEHAAAYAGISYDTLNEWRKSKPEFSEALWAAESKGVLVCLAKIRHEATDGDWRASAWLLEHRYSAIYGKQLVEQTGHMGITVEHVSDWRNVGGGEMAELDEAAATIAISANGAAHRNGLNGHG